VKRAPVLCNTRFGFRRSTYRASCFVQKANTWQLAEAESYTVVHITLKRMPVYSKGYVNAVQRQCDRSG
jgi:hypothetical protein